MKHDLYEWEIPRVNKEIDVVNLFKNIQLQLLANVKVVSSLKICKK